MPSFNFSKHEKYLHTYLALSLAKLPGRWDEAEEQARKAMKLKGGTEEIKCLQDIKEFVDKFLGCCGLGRGIDTVHVQYNKQCNFADGGGELDQKHLSPGG